MWGYIQSIMSQKTFSPTHTVSIYVCTSGSTREMSKYMCRSTSGSSTRSHTLTTHLLTRTFIKHVHTCRCIWFTRSHTLTTQCTCYVYVRVSECMLRVNEVDLHMCTCYVDVHVTLAHTHIHRTCNLLIHAPFSSGCVQWHVRTNGDSEGFGPVNKICRGLHFFWWKT